MTDKKEQKPTPEQLAKALLKLPPNHKWQYEQKEKKGK